MPLPDHQSAPKASSLIARFQSQIDNEASVPSSTLKTASLNRSASGSSQPSESDPRNSTLPLSESACEPPASKPLEPNAQLDTSPQSSKEDKVKSKSPQAASPNNSLRSRRTSLASPTASWLAKGHPPVIGKNALRRSAGTPTSRPSSSLTAANLDQQSKAASQRTRRPSSVLSSPSQLSTQPPASSTTKRGTPSNTSNRLSSSRRAGTTPTSSNKPSQTPTKTLSAAKAHTSSPSATAPSRSPTRTAARTSVKPAETTAKQPERVKKSSTASPSVRKATSSQTTSTSTSTRPSANNASILSKERRSSTATKTSAGVSPRTRPAAAAATTTTSSAASRRAKASSSASASSVRAAASTSRAAPKKKVQDEQPDEPVKAHDEPDTDEQHTSQKSVADVFNESTSSTRSSNEPQPQLDVGEEAPASESAPADDATKEDVQVSSGAETPGQLSSLQPDLHSRAVSETVSEMPSDIPDIDELPSATPSRIVSVSQQVSDPSLLVQAGQVDAAQDLTQSDPSVPAFKIDEQMSEPRYDDAPAYDWGSRDNALPALPKEPPSPALSTDSNGQPKKSVPIWMRKGGVV